MFEDFLFMARGHEKTKSPPICNAAKRFTKRPNMEGTLGIRQNCLHLFKKQVQQQNKRLCNSNVF